MVARFLPSARRRLAACLALGACVALTGFTAARTTPARAAGIYTKEQAERGRAPYDKWCASCHGARLEGATSTPLAGDEFIASWGKPNLTLDDFYYIVRKTMPKDEPGTLERQTYLDVVALILQENGFAPGDSEFTADTAVMKQVRFRAAPPPTK